MSKLELILHDTYTAPFEKYTNHHSIAGTEPNRSTFPKVEDKALVFLMRHQELIPEDWKGKCIYFLGTIYCDKNGLPYVRTLEWYKERWHSELVNANKQLTIQDYAIGLKR